MGTTDPVVNLTELFTYGPARVTDDPETPGVLQVWEGEALVRRTFNWRTAFRNVNRILGLPESDQPPPSNEKDTAIIELAHVASSLLEDSPMPGAIRVALENKIAYYLAMAVYQPYTPPPTHQPHHH